MPATAQRPSRKADRKLTWNREHRILWIKQGKEEVGYFVDEIRAKAA